MLAFQNTRRGAAATCPACAGARSSVVGDATAKFDLPSRCRTPRRGRRPTGSRGRDRVRHRPVRRGATVERARRAVRCGCWRRSLAAPGAADRRSCDLLAAAERRQLAGRLERHGPRRCRAATLPRAVRGAGARAPRTPSRSSAATQPVATPSWTPGQPAGPPPDRAGRRAPSAGRALALPRSLELVVGLLGGAQGRRRLPAGGPELSGRADRATCCATPRACVRADDRHSAGLPATACCRCVLDDPDTAGAPTRTRAPDAAATAAAPGHPAYVIYTSGSTGRPKGVVGRAPGP